MWCVNLVSLTLLFPGLGEGDSSQESSTVWDFEVFKGGGANRWRALTKDLRLSGTSHRGKLLQEN